jgi:transposase
MSKYSRKLKIVIAKKYLDDESSHQLGREYNISSRQIRYWGAVYSLNHEHSFLPPVSAYSAKDKLKILTRMQTEDWSLEHTGAFFNLSSPGTLFVWLCNYEFFGMEGLKPKKCGALMKKTPIVKPKAATEMTESELIDELDKPDVYAEIKTKIKEIFHLHKGRYGYRRITLALRNLGMLINRKKVQRLMRVLNLKSKVRPKRYNSYKGQEGESVTNLLQRDFTASKPNQKWVTDVTEFNAKSLKVYLSPLIDLFSGDVVAYRIAKSAHLPLVKDI